MLVVASSADRLVGVAAEWEESLRHRLKMPYLASTTSKGFFPLASKAFRYNPAKLVVPEAGTDHVASLVHLRRVNKTFTTMQDRKVVDEVNITRLCCDFKLRRLGNVFYCVQCLDLDWRQLRQIIRARMSSTSYQRSSAKVGNQLAILVVNNRSAVELGPVETECQWLNNV